MSEPATEPRTWEQVRADAIQALMGTALNAGRGDLTIADAQALTDAVLAVMDEEALNRMAGEFVNETRIRAIDFRQGASMDLEPSETLVANWVAAAKTWLDHHGAVNYTETAVDFTKVEQEVKIAGEFDRFAFILQRVAPGKLTPHEARKRAEAGAERLRAALRELAQPHQPNGQADPSCVECGYLWPCPARGIIDKAEAGTDA